MKMTVEARHLRSSSPLRRVLVVDDDGETRSVLSDYLGGIGYELKFATSGGRALDLLRTRPLPDVIVCGEWRSGPGIADFIRRLGADAATSTLPVLRMAPEGSPSVANPDGSDAAIRSPLRFLELGDELFRLQDPRR